MRVLALVLMIVLSAPALAQHRERGGERQGKSQNMSHDERRRLREDVDSARGNYARPDPRRQDRMAPEEREKLRRDVQDANRDLRRK